MNDAADHWLAIHDPDHQPTETGTTEPATLHVKATINMREAYALALHLCVADLGAEADEAQEIIEGYVKAAVDQLVKLEGTSRGQ